MEFFLTNFKNINYKNEDPVDYLNDAIEEAIQNSL